MNDILEEYGLVVDTAEEVVATEIPFTRTDLIADASFLNKYYFPVSVGTVRRSGPTVIDGATYDTLYPANNYKAIVRSDTNELIAIMKQTYKIVENRRVIESVMEGLERVNANYMFDRSHSFVSNGRMKLHITFPDYRLMDNESEIPLCVYIHNSYDGSEGIRVLWGAIRSICTNGMVFGKLLSSVYKRHTLGVNLGGIGNQLRSTLDAMPKLQARIDSLRNGYPDMESFLPEIKKTMGITLSKHVEDSAYKITSQWDMLNVLTDYVSHKIEKRLQTHYQNQISKVFQL